MSVNGSEQLNWYPTRLFLEQVLAQANCGPLPWPGTPAWCDLGDGDPRKLLALAEFGVHHALRVDAAQQARAEASRAVAADEDWSALARSVRDGRGGAYIPREVAR